MGLSTHVLDTMHGGPAAGMQVKLFATQGDSATLLKTLTLNHDGRTDAPLFDNASLQVGTYRLTFDVAGYFKARGVQLPEPNFLNQVSLDFAWPMPTSTTTCRCWSAPGAIPPTAAPDPERLRGLHPGWGHATFGELFSPLAFTERVQLEAPGLVPQPGVGVAELAAHAGGVGEGAAARTVRSISATTSGAWVGARSQCRRRTPPLRSSSTSSTPIAYSIGGSLPW
jgi:5-hydroxyisourate hydrolase